MPQVAVFARGKEGACSLLKVAAALVLAEVDPSVAEEYHRVAVALMSPTSACGVRFNFSP